MSQEMKPEHSADEPCARYVAPVLSLQDHPCVHCGKLEAEHVPQGASTPPPFPGLQKVLGPEKYGVGYSVVLAFKTEEQAAAAALDLDRATATKRSCRCNSDNPAKCAGVPWGEYCECECHRMGEEHE